MMGNVNVINYDFSKMMSRMVAQTQADADDVIAAHEDLRIVLSAAAAQPGKRFAMTRAADDALHALLLDTKACAAFTRDAIGPGAVIEHDPDAWDQPEYAEAWSNTRGAFGQHGVTLPANRDDAMGDGARAAAACWVTIALAA